MKLVYAVLLLLLGIVSINPQDPQPADIGRTESKYDGIADTTTVQCVLIELGRGAPRLVVQANASFRGKEPNETAIFWLGLSSFRAGATRRTKPLFKDTTTIRLLVDSTLLEVPVKGYRSDFYELNRLFAEHARAEISREDLRKLLDAKILEGKWGEVEFKFSGDALGSLKAFISSHVLTVSDR
jgi:hypothetical protein